MADEPTEPASDLVLAALAEVRAVELSELEEALSQDPTACEVDSQEAETVIAILEERTGKEIPQVEDLVDDEPLSVKGLTAHIAKAFSGSDAED